MPGPAIIALGAGLAGYTLYRGIRHGDWGTIKVGPKEPGYKWEDSDGDWGMEKGKPPTDGSHPRKPGKWTS